MDSPMTLDRIEAIEQREQAATPGPWQPIETAPKDGTQVLLFGKSTDADGEVIRAGWWSTSAWWGPAWIGYENRSDTEYLTPTHWLPLPDPPAKQNDRRG